MIWYDEYNNNLNYFIFNLYNGLLLLLNINNKFGSCYIIIIQLLLLLRIQFYYACVH